MLLKIQFEAAENNDFEKNERNQLSGSALSMQPSLFVAFRPLFDFKELP